MHVAGGRSLPVVDRQVVLTIPKRLCLYRPLRPLAAGQALRLRVDVHPRRGSSTVGPG